MKAWLRGAGLSVVLASAVFAQGKSDEHKGHGGEKDKKDMPAAAKAQGKGNEMAAPGAMDAGAAAVAPAMPVLPPEGKKLLESMVGKWKSSDSVMTLGGQPMKGKVNMDCDKVVDGWGTLCKARFDFGKQMPVQLGTFLFAWSLGEGMAHMFEVSNMGDTHNHVGKWTDDKSITLVHDGKSADGKVEKDTLSFTFNAPKQLAVSGNGVIGGAPAWSMTGTFTK
jgi:hypothetical protein